MLFRELNRGKCKTYLVACERTRRAALIDPVKTQAGSGAVVVFCAAGP